MIFRLAVQCSAYIKGSNDRCGQWNAVTTNNIHKASMICKKCGSSKKVRGKFGWNAKTVVLQDNQDMGEVIKRLNSPKIIPEQSSGFKSLSAYFN